MTSVQEKIAIMQAYADGESLEMAHANHVVKEWTKCSEPAWAWDFYEYRIAEKEPARPDFMDWSQIHPKYRFFARDEGGSAYIYEKRPGIDTNSDYWHPDGGDCIRIDHFLTSYRPGTTPWNESLIERS